MRYVFGKLTVMACHAQGVLGFKEGFWSPDLALLAEASSASGSSSTFNASAIDLSSAQTGSLKFHKCSPGACVQGANGSLTCAARRTGPLCAICEVSGAGVCGERKLAAATHTQAGCLPHLRLALFTLVMTALSAPPRPAGTGSSSLSCWQWSSLPSLCWSSEPPARQRRLTGSRLPKKSSVLGCWCLQ